MRYEAGLYEEAGTGEFIYKIAFNFTIPTKLLSHDPTINEQLLQLPPSFKAGEAITDTAGQTFMQPLIDYILQAVVHFDGLVPGPPVKVQSAREIMLVPFTEIGPPLATEDFPGEYTSISTRSLSKIPFGGLFGEMSISMDEPPALRFSEGLLSARSLGYLKLILRPKDDVANTIKQRRLKCTIKSGIVVKVFSSMTPLHGMPTYSMLQTDKYLRVRARHVSLQTRRVDVFLSKADGQPLPGGSRERQDFTWTTSLYLPIYSTKLLPTFCSTQAALCYALRVQLNFSGVYHSPFVLNVPLQVLHCKEAETVRVGWIAVDYYDQRTIDNQIDVLDVSSQVSHADCITDSLVINTLQLPELERLPPAYNCD